MATFPRRPPTAPGPLVRRVLALATADVAAADGVRGAAGTVVGGRGSTVVHITATVEPGADLGVVIRSTDRAAARVHRRLATRRAHCRFTLLPGRQPEA